MKTWTSISLLFFLQAAGYLVSGFVAPSLRSNIGQYTVSKSRTTSQDATLLRYPSSNPLLSVAASASTTGETPVPVTQKGKKTLKELRQEGGIFTINTPIGALNPYAIYYGLMSIFLGIPWYFGLKLTQLMYFITRGKVDKKRRIPVFLSQCWGTTLMRLTRSTPIIENKEILTEFFKKNQPAMFCANHCSWTDIPFLGVTVGWRNYKLVSKKELGQVPILGAAIRIGGNVLLDRSDRRSQLRTLKQGINLLGKENVHLCTFPEGTRSRTGRLLPFKNGAFKMAYKAGAPVIPISIVHTNKVMPTGWMFQMRPSRKIAKVVVHEPVESKGKTEDELAEAVRQSVLNGLPDDQKPLK